MIVAFVESIKYVGHLLPLAFLRVFIGYFYLNETLIRLHTGFLEQAYLAEDVRSYLPHSSAPEWYRAFLENILIPNWQIFAYAIVIMQIFVGLSYVIGYLVRPASIIGIFLCLNMMWAISSHPAALQNTFLLVLHITLGWMGAGRCLGFDYFFYKRRRGIWW
jgi:thiosulfate dehydrogenase [quinone] large subunit